MMSKKGRGMTYNEWIVISGEDRGKSLKLRPGMSATQPRDLGGAMKSNLFWARAGVIYVDMSIISETPPYSAKGGD
jgi:hypothetical protein